MALMGGWGWSHRSQLGRDLGQTRAEFRGLMLQSSAAPEAVISHYQRAVGQYPQSATLQLRLGQALMQTLPPQLPPASITSSPTPSLVTLLPAALQAETHLQKAVFLDPTLLEARLAYAECLARQQRFNDAVAQYRDALKLHPNSPQLLEALSQFYTRVAQFAGKNGHLQAKNWFYQWSAYYQAQAIGKQTTHPQQKSPKASKQLNQLGQAQLQGKQFGMAAHSFCSALLQSPALSKSQPTTSTQQSALAQLAQTRYNLGYALVKAGYLKPGHWQIQQALMLAQQQTAQPNLAFTLSTQFRYLRSDLGDQADFSESPTQAIAPSQIPEGLNPLCF